MIIWWSIPNIPQHNLTRNIVKFKIYHLKELNQLPNQLTNHNYAQSIIKNHSTHEWACKLD